LKFTKVAEDPVSERFPCKQCGAILKYAPGTQHQVCVYCSSENYIELRAGIIREYPLQEALNKLSEHRPVPLKKQIHCDECGATFQFESSVHAGECPFCGTPIVVSTVQSKMIQPKSLLPFSIDKQTAHKLFDSWLKGLWFAPNAVKKFARRDAKLRGVYLPYWTFDSETATRYHGERGDVYYVRQNVRVRRGKHLVTEVRRVPKIRWTPVSGRVSRFFDDVLIGASRSLPRRIVDTLEPWDLNQLTPYDEKYLSGFQSEFYQVEIDKGFDYAKQVMDNQIYRDIAFDIGGAHQRIHSTHTAHDDNTYKHCLLPIWSAAFRYRDKSYRFVINGRTGAVQGDRPYSVWKIGFAVLAALIVLATGAIVMDGMRANNIHQQGGYYYPQPSNDYNYQYKRY
jgi:DNA-directed RNA polymerase subunit RPC12/RpoP